MSFFDELKASLEEAVEIKNGSCCFAFWCTM